MTMEELTSTVKIYMNPSLLRNEAFDECSRLVEPNLPEPIPANPLAVNAQIQFAAAYQRRLRRKRRQYYILLISSIAVTVIAFVGLLLWLTGNIGDGAPVHNSVPPPDIIKSNDSIMTEPKVINQKKSQFTSNLTRSILPKMFNKGTTTTIKQYREGKVDFKPNKEIDYLIGKKL